MFPSYEPWEDFSATPSVQRSLRDKSDKPTLLLIDDDNEIRFGYSCFLRSIGYTVWTAGSGGEGLKIALSQYPDLILCDYELPDTRGDLLLGEFRAEPSLHRSQVILITGHAERCGLRRAMNCGADDYLSKPVMVEDLLRCVETRMRRVRQCRDGHGGAVEASLGEHRDCVSHAFFTPLSGILGTTQILKSHFAGLSASEITDLLEDLEVSGWRLQRNIRNYLCLLEIRDPSSGEKPGVMDPDSVCAAVLQGAEAAVARHGRAADLDIDLADCPVYSDSEALAILTEELVENACAFSDSGTPICVRLDPEQGLMVKDRGLGMSEETLDRIHAGDPPAPESNNRGGLGIGLFIVRRIARRFGASLDFASKEGHGATVFVRFSPAAKASNAPPPKEPTQILIQDGAVRSPAGLTR